MNLSDDSLVKVTIDLRHLLVKDTCGKVDIYQIILNEGDTVYHSFEDFGIHLLQIIPRLLQA